MYAFSCKRGIEEKLQTAICITTGVDHILLFTLRPQ